MYPRIARKGTSFKGAALYYLHDKEAQTNDRVEFTQTQNLHTDDPEMAWKMMAYTAMNQNDIKKAAGVKNTGNKAKTTVYSYSLSWKPSERKDEFNISAGNSSSPPEPTMEEMIKAGLDTLKIMGLHEHESMIVGHNDTAHSHIHVIVNRVHPETGIIDTHSNDKLKLSKWAEKHEREQGQILCKARAENNERRRNGEYVKFKEETAKAEYYRWQREKTRQACEQREKDAKNLDGLQKQKRDELLNNKETLIKEKIAQIRELNRSSWASIYRQQKEDSLTTQEAQRSAMSRFFDYLKNRNQEREHGALDAKRGLCSGAYNAVTSGDEVINALNKKQEQERKAFAEKIAEQTRSSLEQMNKDYVCHLEVLRANQIKEQDLMKARHSEESQQRAKDIASGKAKEDFDRQNIMNEFRETQEPQNDNKPPPDLKKDFNNERKGRAVCMDSTEDQNLDKSKIEETVEAEQTENISTADQSKTTTVAGEIVTADHQQANQSVTSKTQDLDYTSDKMEKSEVKPEFNQKTNEKEKEPLQQKITTPEMEHVLNPPGMDQQNVNTHHVSPPHRDKNVVESNDNQEEVSGIKKEFNVFRKMEKENELDNANDLKKDEDIKKEFNAFRNLKEENERDNSSNIDTGKDTGMEHG